MNYSKFEPLLGDWGEKLKPFIESEECDKMYDLLKQDAKRGKKIFPLSANVYRAFKETPFNDLKVVFVAYDPYAQMSRDGTVIADGIAFSCANTEKEQPSLELFYNGIEDDLYNGLKLDYLREPDLKYLCNQGIMMTNSALTVEKDKTGSHEKIWRPFMKYLYEEVFAKYNNGLVFVLAGKVSQELEKFINPLQHYIIKVEHPAFAYRQKRPWNHQKLFSQVNYILKTNNNIQLNWVLEEAPF